MAEHVFSILTITLPYRLLSYYPFRNRLRLPWKTVLFLIGISEMVFCLLTGMVFINGGNSRIIEFIMAPVCIAIFFLNIRVEPSKLTFLYIFVTNHAMMVRGLAAFIMARWFPEVGVSSWTDSLISWCLFVATLPIVLRLWCSTVKRMLEVQSPGFWHTIWIAPAFTTVVILAYTYEIDSIAAGSFRFLFSRIGLFACMLVVYYVLLQSLDTIRSQAVLEEEVRSNSQLLMLQRNQYELLVKRIEEIRSARHDLCQHLKLIQSYLASGDKAALADYVAAYGQTLPTDTIETYCCNPAVNTIVSYYGEQAKKQEVAFDTSLDLPLRIGLPEPDLCVIIGNLLENALNASKMGEANSFIKMRAFIKDGKELVLTVDNGTVPEPIIKDGQFVSTKHEGNGIGTLSVKRIAAHYNGVVDFSWQNQVFYASVYLPFFQEGSVPDGEKVE